MFKHRNGRIQRRNSCGRFRKSTLQDLGIPQSEIAMCQMICGQCYHNWRPFLLLEGVPNAVIRWDTSPKNKSKSRRIYEKKQIAEGEKY